MYLTAFMQVTCLGCEIPRSKECPTNPLKNNFNTYFFTLKVPIAPNHKGVCLQNTSKPHSYHLKIW